MPYGKSHEYHTHYCIKLLIKLSNKRSECSRTYVRYTLLSNKANTHIHTHTHTHTHTQRLRGRTSVTWTCQDFSSWTREVIMSHSLEPRYVRTYVRYYMTLSLSFLFLLLHFLFYSFLLTYSLLSFFFHISPLSLFSLISLFSPVLSSVPPYHAFSVAPPILTFPYLYHFYYLLIFYLPYCYFWCLHIKPPLLPFLLSFFRCLINQILIDCLNPSITLFPTPLNFPSLLSPCCFIFYSSIPI